MIELTPNQQAFVDAQVATGTFPGPREVVGAALEMLAARQREYDQLKTAIEQVEKGNFAPLDVVEIKRRGLDRKATT